MHRLRLLKGRLTPSLVISMISLFVALSSVAYAAEVVPLAVRALTANKADTAKVADRAKTATKAITANTAKVANRAKTADSAKTADTATTAQTADVAVDSQTLGGQTAAQIAATPGPASSIAGTTFTVRSKGWSTQNEGDKTTERVFCNAGEKAVGGGWDMPNGHADQTADAPLADLTGWVFRTWAISGNNVPANGSVWVVCAKVS